MRLLKELEDLFFPKVCPLCGEDIRGKDVLCPKCCSEIPPVPSEKTVVKAGSFDRFFYRAPYSGVVREVIKAYKYSARISLSELLSDLAVELLETFPPPENAVMTTVPITFSSLKEKGFDHMKKILGTVSKKTGIPSFDLLEVVRQKNRQAASSISRRKSQVTGKYGVILRKFYKTSGTILLLDDVFTTGATVEECSRVLKESGASKVWIYTIARVVDD